MLKRAIKVMRNAQSFLERWRLLRQLAILSNQNKGTKQMSMVDLLIKKIFEEGRRSRINGISRHTIPQMVTIWEKDAWLSGWDDPDLAIPAVYSIK